MCDNQSFGDYSYAGIQPAFSSAQADAADFDLIVDIIDTLQQEGRSELEKWVLLSTLEFNTGLDLTPMYLLLDMDEVQQLAGVDPEDDEASSDDQTPVYNSLGEAFVGGFSHAPVGGPIGSHPSELQELSALDKRTVDQASAEEEFEKFMLNLGFKKIGGQDSYRHYIEGSLIKNAKRS